MATTAIIATLESLAANIPSKLHELLSRSPTPPSSSASLNCYQIEEELEKLCRKLKRIQALLEDAEEQEIRENHIKLWLNELRDLAYDAEDMVEDFEYELRRFELLCEEWEQQDKAAQEEKGSPCSKDQISESHVKPPRPALHDDGLFQQQIVDRINKFNNQFQEICEDRSALELSKKGGKKHKKQKVMQRPPSSSVTGNLHVYGRNADKDEVVNMILSTKSPHEYGAENVSVVSIVGMGGVGKTTLAQIVYNDGRLRNHFEERSWVCVSNYFDVVRLTQEILKTFPGEEMQEIQGLDPLQRRLEEKLRGKRFLLVLDDLWNESLGHWEALWRPLCAGAAGSKVLITTRNKQVSRASRAIGMHPLSVLSGRDSCSLFEQCAFGRKNPDEHPQLVSIGKKIVQKCGGLPLAIKTLGGILFDETNEEKWNEVLNSDVWDLPAENSDILPALKLSYNHLPPPVKPCFAFCALFPKDYLFDQEELVFFWMAQGYTRSSTSCRCMEDVGREYFEALVQRSFFEVSDGTILYKMHDLTHDLALSICEGECSEVKYGKLPINALRRVRHISAKREEDVQPLLACGSADRLQYLRTFIFQSTEFYVSLEFLDDIFRHMKYLRVLDLRKFIFKSLPDSVSKLKHLRFLGISVYGSCRLPESLCDLFSLQTFYFTGGLYRQELPKRLKNLINLRHLLVYNGGSAVIMPQGIGRLTQLRTLPTLAVGARAGAEIEELRHLNDLEGKLEIVVRSLSNSANRVPHILDSKKRLKRIVLRFHDYGGWSLDGLSFPSSKRQRQQEEEEIIELIRPHTNLEEIEIRDYRGSKLPKWLVDPSYARLRKIGLSSCWHCRQLPELGQVPSLKELAVSYMRDDLTRVGHEFLGFGGLANGASPFPSLERLSLEYLSGLKELGLVGTEEVGGPFRRLCFLQIKSCFKLEYVKLRHLSAIEELHILKCHSLTTLDCYDASLSQQSAGLQGEVVHCMHLPLIRTMRLLHCPKLKFAQLAEQLGRHIDKSSRVTYIVTDEFVSLHNPDALDKNVRYYMQNAAKLKLTWHLEQPDLTSTVGRDELFLNDYCGHYSFLEELVIQGHQGQIFPFWGRAPSAGYLDGWQWLPALDQLLQNEDSYFPNLRVLSIISCPKLRIFHFQLLERPPDSRAGIGRMELSSYPHSSSSSRSFLQGPFPHLKLLFIRDCPELVSLIGVLSLPSLAILDIGGCPSLDFPQEAQLPHQLQKVKIWGCPLLSGWCQANNQACHVHVLQLDEETEGSDGRSYTESLNALQGIIRGEESSGSNDTTTFPSIG